MNDSDKLPPDADLPQRPPAISPPGVRIEGVRGSNPLSVRSEEARALTWDHVDMEAGTVSVWRSVRAHGDTKTQRSRRTLKLPEIAVEALHQQMRRQADERSNAGELWQEHGLVFTTTVGTPYESHNLRRDFSRVTKAAGIGAQWVPKELRTSFVGMVSYQGVPVEEIARLTGPKRYVVLDTDVASRAIKGKLGEPPQVSALIVAQIEWQRTSVQATAPR